MRTIIAEIDGVKYSCPIGGKIPMGAMLRFKEETGREASEMRSNSISDIITWLYCGFASEAARQKKDFPYMLQDFADNLDMEYVDIWRKAMEEANPAASDETDDSKKKRLKSSKS